MIDDLERAKNLFDWTVRNIQLEPDDPNRIPQFPWETLLFGRGTATERAWVFILLLRQLDIDAAVLAVDEGPAARRRGARGEGREGEGRGRKREGERRREKRPRTAVRGGEDREQAPALVRGRVDRGQRLSVRSACWVCRFPPPTA